MPVSDNTADAGLSLALAMVCASPSPLLLLDGECRIIAVSASFCSAFGIEPATVVERLLFEIGDGEWDTPQLRSLMEATSSGAAQIDSYEFELVRVDQPRRCLVLNARKLSYDNGEEARLLIAVTDVTDARRLALRDQDLAHANTLLIQEVQHRIANSLQIIASVIMLNARRTSSEETRGHLRNAHSRVMSVAELQQQLAVSTSGDVNIGAYLTRLCATISASMVDDPETLPIVVTAPDLLVDAEASVSLGLIVTELVINALKHGFPDQASGRIDVIYAAEGAEWTLSVNDTGVGMPKETLSQPGGLGTSIVQALARQLRATVQVNAQNPGTAVSVVHALLPASGAAPPSTPQIQRV